MQQLIINSILIIIGFLVYMYVLTIILKPYQIQRVFHWTNVYYMKYDDMLGTLIILETILSPINLCLLLISGWKWRL